MRSIDQLARHHMRDQSPTPASQIGEKCIFGIERRVHARQGTVGATSCHNIARDNPQLVKRPVVVQSGFRE